MSKLHLIFIIFLEKSTKEGKEEEKKKKFYKKEEKVVKEREGIILSLRLNQQEDPH